MITNPYIKDPANIAWLEANEEHFLDWMAKHHSLVDICHTILHIDSLDDKYIANLIKQVEAADKKKLKEEKNRKKAIKSNTVPKETAVEKKMKAMEDIADSIENAKGEDSLFD